MRWISRLLLFGTLLYGAAVLGMVTFQRSLMYFPGPAGGSAADNGLGDTQTFRVTSGDGESIVAWFKPPADGKPLFLYFHGNGGSLADRDEVFHRLTDDGSGLLAIDYRGYGGSTGTPTEAGFLLDGDAAFRRLATLGVTPERTVIIGESIGTGVAVAVAEHQPIRALVLDSSFSSAADVAQSVYRWLPVRFLMLDKFDSVSRIAHVEAPKLFLHGGLDRVIPMMFARKLYDRASPPKTFIELPGLGHAVMFDPQVPARIKEWLATLPPLPHPS